MTTESYSHQFGYDQESKSDGHYYFEGLYGVEEITEIRLWIHLKTSEIV